MNTLSWDKILYTSDLVTFLPFRQKGAGSMLLGYAKEQNCKQVRLDTGYMRHMAHWLYLRNNFKVIARHMVLEL